MKQREPRRRSGRYHQQSGSTRAITRAVTHIQLEEVNASKLAALDAVAEVYHSLCQQYVMLFCRDEAPDPYRATYFTTPLSQRWQRVAIQQAAGIAQAWRTNHTTAHQAYLEAVAAYQEQQTSTKDADASDAHLNLKRKAPVWKEWNIPLLKQTCMQANVNVVSLEPSQDSTFDYWLKISTLEFRKQLCVPVKLADYHRKILKRTGLTSKRFAVGSVAPPCTPMRMQQRTLPADGMIRKCKCVRTDKRSKLC